MNDLHALFLAVGPDFKHIDIAHFANVDVYALLCHPQGIKEAANDGNIDKISNMLLEGSQNSLERFKDCFKRLPCIC